MGFRNWREAWERDEQLMHFKASIPQRQVVSHIGKFYGEKRRD